MTTSGLDHQDRRDVSSTHHALPLTHADQAVYTEAAQRAEAGGDAVIARALGQASRGGGAIVELLRHMNTQLERGDIESVAAQVRALLQPIHDLDQNEPILTAAVAELATPIQALLNLCPAYQLSALLLTDDASLAALDEQLLAIEDQVQEARRRVEERRHLLAGRDLAGNVLPTSSVLAG